MFDGLFDRFQKWTNLKLSQIDSKKYADLYFNNFPSEINPVWNNPCDDKRHLEMIPQVSHEVVTDSLALEFQSAIIFSAKTK